MPNDCTNSLEIKGITTDQWRSIDDSFAVRDEDHQQDFLKTFIPEPDYTVTPGALTFPESEARLATTEEDRERILKNEPTIREDSWWDWRVQNWGTKWDVYGVCRGGTKEEPSDCFSSNFLTAWSPLGDRCMEELSKKFPGATLVNFYVEEGNDFCGVTVAKDGISEGHYEPEMHQYKEPFLRQQFPDLMDRLAGYLDETDGDREEALQEFFWNASDPGEFSDFVRDQLEEKLEPMLSRVIAATSAISEELTK